ncbi:MAG: hypothetical protein COU33_00350 [Candidatus Magasanikbacteria bacterium CG10_big_fil_rev_8_21_14_0_10_43_6]|uniref:Peptidase M23 domain-containing protein n=1 Tax=Candidatus Magasanikbacteria bacterium CG10_big_fil_rev_8_21_14_0_10_43_6 TaxID=1974650 RepID=A0A2M6W2L0_9BACT|nr:MAG: hypothetical protein COU33_00350 [Candidatus Magasanikbacteria bacterium CG10_big_fil_rev_8_21_14_0_10_43_6]
MRIVLPLTLLLFLGIGCHTPLGISDTNTSPLSVVDRVMSGEDTPPVIRYDFSVLDPTFRFSAILPEGAMATYVPEIESIHVTNPSQTDSSLFFIRTFRANNFLTLSTVSILDQEKTTIHNHAATRYHIEKKPGIPNFPSQPAWRNNEHRLIDIRFSEQNPSWFYVFAYNPAVDETIFDSFIASLEFHNDPASFVPPLLTFEKRVTKKPFGIFIDPATSPVQPEKFSGYHTAVDFETFSDEEDTPVGVNTFCGGEITTIEQVTGYGGLVTQRCILEHTPLSILYGHVDIASVSSTVGTYLPPGTPFAVLGDGFTEQTGGERKHLHLGMYAGSGRDIRGYVASKDALQAWRDPLLLLQPQ